MLIFSEPKKLKEKCSNYDIIRFEKEGNKLFIELSHHDGTHYFEVKGGKMITKKEYNYVVNLFFNESPYKKYESKDDILKEFLKDFILKHSFLLETNKIYYSKEFSKLVRNYNNGKNYEKNNDNIRIKSCTDWKENISLKADLIFYGYICKKYKFKIKKNHSYIELI